MTDSAWCVLHLSARPGVPLVAGLVAESADLLGLGPSERSRLRTFVQEVVEAIVTDSFEGDTTIDLDVSVERRPGGLAIVIDDRGAPSKLSHGEYPPRIADLIRLGFADEVSVHSEGVSGNHTVIRKDLPFPSLTDSEDFGAAVESSPAEAVELDDEGRPVLDIRAMTPEDVLEVARLFYRVYGYSLVHSPIVYEPERLAEHVRAGQHLGTVAVTSSGRIIGHVSSTIEAGRRTGRIGFLAVEPSYRKLHVATMLGYAHFERLLEHGIIGQFTEAVTVHTGSQTVALRSGGHEVGMLLAAQHADMQYQGIVTKEDERHAVMLIYGSLAGPGPERTVHVPAAFTGIATDLYQRAKLPRVLPVTDPRPPRELPETSRFDVRLSHESGVARLTVERYGLDFDRALQTQLNTLRVNRYDLIWVYLPLSDPLTGFFGNGLHELGLSFSGIYPEYTAEGDVLVMQCLNNVEFDPAEIKVASPFGEQLRDFVMADYERARDSSSRLMRSRAQMARFYEALG